MKETRILFLGNSITQHGPRPEIGWTANCGMAASSEDHDYVHLFLREWAAKTGHPAEAMIRNIADFEREFDEFTIHDRLKEEIAFRADVAILAIGENVPALTDADSQFRFGNRLQTLIAAVKTRPDAALFVRSCFWADTIKDAILQQACAVANGVFVDISRLGQDEANYARSERSFADAGVAAHPGDRGMRAIAEALLVASRPDRNHSSK